MLCPKDCSPYCTANRPPVSNQRPPEILEGRHPPGGSWQDTGRRHPTDVGGDWGWGRGGQKVHHTRGEWHKKQAQLFVPCLCGTPRAGTARSAGHAPYRTAGSLSSVERKAAPAPPRSATELATQIRVHLRPPVSGLKLGTEETGKQAK